MSLTHTHINIRIRARIYANINHEPLPRLNIRADTRLVVVACTSSSRPVNPATNGAHRIARGESQEDGRANERDGNRSFFIVSDEVPVREKTAERERKRECIRLRKEKVYV